MRDHLRLMMAVRFAAERHANHRRKGAAQEPYVDHLIEVADLVARATDGTARIVKTADAISNLRCMAESPPAGWPLGWRLRYVDGMRAMHDRMRGASPALDELFDTQEADSRAALTAMGTTEGFERGRPG